MASVKCEVCTKTVYPMEKITVEGKPLHEKCFRCLHCKNKISLGSFASMGGKFYCKPHFKQLFAEKGNYSAGFGEADPKAKWAPQANLTFQGTDAKAASASSASASASSAAAAPAPTAEPADEPAVAEPAGDAAGDAVDEQ